MMRTAFGNKLNVLYNPNSVLTSGTIAEVRTESRHLFIGNGMEVIYQG